MIDAFLILAREADMKPQSEDFDVADILLDEADNARALLIGKHVDLEVTCNAKPRLHAPPRVMHVVVSNLLRNACSYTDTGRIDVILEQDRVIVRDTRTSSRACSSRSIGPSRCGRRAPGLGCPSCVACASASAGKSRLKACRCKALPRRYGSCSDFSASA